MLHHQSVVGGDIGFTLHGIDDDTLSLGCRWRTEFDKGRESGTSHTRNTCVLYAFYNLFGCEFGMCFYGLKRLAPIDTLFPLISLYIDYDDWFAIACSIE